MERICKINLGWNPHRESVQLISTHHVPLEPHNKNRFGLTINLWANCATCPWDQLLCVWDQIYHSQTPVYFPLESTIAANWEPLHPFLHSKKDSFSQVKGQTTVCTSILSLSSFTSSHLIVPRRWEKEIVPSLFRSTKKWYQKMLPITIIITTTQQSFNYLT
jgi:hypothetical protein